MEGYSLPDGRTSALAVCHLRQWVLESSDQNNTRPDIIPDACDPVCEHGCNDGTCIYPGNCLCGTLFYGFACQFKKCFSEPQKPDHGSFVGT